MAEDIRPEKGDIVIGKTRFSGFFGTKLDLVLRRLGIRRLLLLRGAISQLHSRHCGGRHRA